MTRADSVDALSEAAHILGVTVPVRGWPEEPDGSTWNARDPRARLHLAAAVLGAVEAQVIMAASHVAADDPADPMEAVDRISFHTAGMQTRDPGVSDAMWTIWAVRRGQAHVAAMTSDGIDSAPHSRLDTAQGASTRPARAPADESHSQDELISSAALLAAAHALLSAFVHRLDHNPEEQTDCLDFARSQVADVTARLARAWPQL